MRRLLWRWRWGGGVPRVPPPDTHIILQQDEHAALGQLLGREELVPGLLHLLRRDLSAAPPLVVQVQSTAVHLLQLVLEEGR